MHGTLETVEVALLPSGAFGIINLRDFDPKLHVRWSEWQPKAGAQAAETDSRVEDLGAGWYLYLGRKTRKKNLPPDVLAALEATCDE